MLSDHSALICLFTLNAQFICDRKLHVWFFWRKMFVFGDSRGVGEHPKFLLCSVDCFRDEGNFYLYSQKTSKNSSWFYCVSYFCSVSYCAERKNKITILVFSVFVLLFFIRNFRKKIIFCQKSKFAENLQKMTNNLLSNNERNLHDEWIYERIKIMKFICLSRNRPQF